MPPTVEITERFLSDAGGWQALKEGRGLSDAGKVLDVRYEPPFLRGIVRDGVKEYRAGLRIVTRTNIENVCTCRISRERGMVCAHSLAVGLAFLNCSHGSVTHAGETAENPPIPLPTVSGPYFSSNEGTQAILHVVVVPTFTSGWEKNSIVLGAEFDTAGRRILAHALDPKARYQVPPEDLPAIAAIRQAHGGDLPGMMTLNRSQCRLILQSLVGHPRVTIGRGKPINVAELLAAVVTPVTSPESTPGHESPTPIAPPKFALRIEGSLNYLAAALQARYGDLVFRAGQETNDDLRGRRNVDAEHDALACLQSAGFAAPDSKGEMVLKGERPILRFLGATLPALQRDWTVELGARFTNINETIAKVQPRVEVRGSGENWFELSVSLATPEGQTFSSAEIQRLLQMGQNHVRMKNGGIAIFDPQMLDDLGQSLADCDPKQPQPGTYRISRAHAGYLAAVLGQGTTLEGGADWTHWTRQQLEPDAIAPVPLGPLEEVLRPYQKQGVYWMHFLARNSFGGILADEMGLGKTLQALAFLEGMRGAGISLIVCPSSLIQNWAREAARFTPSMKVITLEGADRHARMSGLAQADIAITSYPLLRRDAGKYGSIEFQAIILDEAQHIKNPETQNAQAAMALRARHRFVLTGTPLENSVRDLWSIMNFVMPGYLGSRNDFKERYEQPIAQGVDG